MTLLTPGDFDLISVEGIDIENGRLYFIASPDNPTQRYLYRAPLDGSGRLERISPKDKTGTHTYTISSDAHLAYHSFSNALQAPVYDIVRLPDHKQIKILEDNQAFMENFDVIEERNISFFRIHTHKAVLDAWEINGVKTSLPEEISGQ